MQFSQVSLGEDLLPSVPRLLPQLRALTALALALCAVGCKNHGGRAHEAAYVSAPQTFLRDRVATVYSKVATVRNGERLDVLERTSNRRFVHVRTASGSDGWVEQRSLVGEDVFQALQRLAKENAAAPTQALSTTHTETNLHVAPGRDTDHLYQLPQGGKLSVLKRSYAEKVLPGAAARLRPLPAANSTATKDSEKDRDDETPEASVPVEPPGKSGPKPILEDWLLVRDAQGRTGWVLARLVDFDIPLEIAQYSEGQRMAAFFVLTEVQDLEKGSPGAAKKVPEYLVLFTEPKDGQPFDFNQVRVFTWNSRRHRYETAYRERKLNGVLPASVGSEDFGKEGTLPTFVLHVRDSAGNIVDRKYKLNGPIVRLVKNEATANSPRRH